METEFQVQVIALRTLKQRCDSLQQRLNSLEEENCKLKLGKMQESNKRTFSENSSRELEEQIMNLVKENSRMAHQLKIISSENFALWSQLSELSSRKDASLESLAFSNITSDQMSNLKTEKPVDLYGDCSSEILEEISLKLINGILKGKNESGKQYSQMIDVQNESNSDVNNLAYARKQFDKRSVMKNLKDHVEKLRDIKEALYQHKNELSSGVSILKKLEILSNLKRNLGSSDNVHYSKEDDVSVNQSETQAEFEKLALNTQDVPDNSVMVCPLCQEVFSGFFIEFYEHVCEHFSVI